MPRTRFAQIISKRRKELRLSIPQAAKVLRMRESVLEAFEEGDFEHLPALGYAQAMIASYARYLGLDSRQITELYEREHEDYVADVTGRKSTGLARLADEPGYRGYTTSVSPARPQSASSTPLHDPYASTRYTESSAARSYASSSQGAYDRPASPSGSYARHDEAQERRYTSRAPQESDERSRRQQATARRRGSEGASRPSRYVPRDEDITTRRVSTGQYRDDMRFDDDVRSYRPSSTRAGRDYQRGVTPPERPRVRRRQQPGRGQDPRMRSGRSQRQRRTGLAGLVDALTANSGRNLLIGMVVLAIVLVLIIVFSIRSCAQGSSEPRQVDVVAAQSATTSAAATLSASEQQALSEAAARQKALSEVAASQETKVKVTVAKGATTWIEVTSDGEQKVADSVTGEWSEEYVVTKSIEIQVADPSVVTVEKNGERVQLSNKTSGLASVTIQGTDPSAATTGSADGDTSGSEDDTNDSASDE